MVTLGAQTKAFVHYRSDGNWGWLEHSKYQGEFEAVAGDIGDRDTVTQAMQGEEVVFHLAALIAIPYSYNSPLSYVRTNIEGTLNVLQAARTENVDLVVHTSTSEVYGSARYVPIDEEHPLQGQSPYSASKIGGDKLAEAFHLSFQMPVATIRPFNTYGPRQSARAVIPTIVTQALSQPEIRLGRLDPTRDFTYVTDTVEGFIRTADTPESVGRVTNIGTGSEVSIGRLAKLILKLVGKNDLPIVSNVERMRPDFSEVDRLCADNSRAVQTLGWSPQLTLEEGLIRTIEWIQANMDRYRPDVYAI